MERALMRSIFGRKAGSAFCSIRVQRTPPLPRSIASVRPVWPAPTIRTSSFIVYCYRLPADHSRRRRSGVKLLERLINRVGALRRSGVDELSHLSAKKDHGLGLQRAFGIELHANEIVLAVPHRLKRRLRDRRPTKVGTDGQGLSEKLEDVVTIIGRVCVGIGGDLRLVLFAAAGREDGR